MSNSPWLIDFLKKIEARPEMYIGGSNVDALSIYLSGYLDAREDLGVNAFHESEKDLLQGFTYWLAVKLNTKATMNWATLISDKIDANNENLRTFYKLFYEYLELRKHESIETLKNKYDNLFGFDT